jgi:hypothetical protein
MRNRTDLARLGYLRSVFSRLLNGGLLIASCAQLCLPSSAIMTLPNATHELFTAPAGAAALAAARTTSPRGGVPQVIDDSGRNQHTGHNENPRRRGTHGHNGKHRR